MTQTKKYKLISLIGVVCFPQMPITCDIRRPNSQKSISSAVQKNEQMVFVTQTKNLLSENLLDCVNPIATTVNILNVFKNKDVLTVEAEGVKRVKIVSIQKENDGLTCEVEEVNEINNSSTTANLLMSSAKQYFVEYSSYDKKFNPELMRLVDTMTSPSYFCDAVATLCIKEESKKLEILNDFDVNSRLEKLIGYLMEAIEI